VGGHFGSSGCVSVGNAIWRARSLIVGVENAFDGT
jgi:hypothetical protein